MKMMLFFEIIYYSLFVSIYMVFYYFLIGICLFENVYNFNIDFKDF